MRYRVLFSVVAVVLLICVYSYADVPKMINFQGRLTDASGKFVSDGNYSLTFKIYSDSSGGSAKWSEAQSVAVSKGLFNVILGVTTPIPDSIFNYPNTWLGIQVGADPEMTPRQRLSSLGYAYYSLNADKLDGYHSSDFIGTATDYGRKEVASQLYEGSTVLEDKYVNENQTGSVTSDMIIDSAIVNADISPSANISASKINDGSGSGLDADLLDGLNSSAFLSTASDYGRLGVATDLYEGTSFLTQKYVNSQGPDSIIATSGIAFSAKAEGSSASPMYGIRGNVENISSGASYGGYFRTSSDGTGTHYGVYGLGEGDAGTNYGGFFATTSSGTGIHYGLRAEGYGSSASTTFGTYSYADNTSSGNVYGGYFRATSSGTGTHYALSGNALSASSSPAYGYYGSAQNSSSGDAYGGFFSTDPSGTGIHYGLRTESYGSSASTTFGTYSYADNTSSGNVYGGYFRATSSGTGTHYGISGNAFSASSSPAYGSYGSAQNSSSGVAYGTYGYGENTSSGQAVGGYFTTSTSGTGVHYGVRGRGFGSSLNSTFGVEGYAENTSGGSAYAGSFYVSSSGTGIHTGVIADGNGSSSNTTYGIRGYASNISTGDAIGGYFEADAAGTGDHYGIYTEASPACDTCVAFGIYSASSGSGYSWAGYFYSSGGGGIYVSAPEGYFAARFLEAVGVSGKLSVWNDFYCSGTKNAAVKVDNREYRLLSCQESPEVWFEDFGEGQLVSGKAHIELDPLFLQTVTINSQHPMKVFVQLNDENCKGTAVKRGTTGFEVIELLAGTSNASFSYRVVAKRKGYEDVRLAKMEGPTPEEMKAQSAKIQADMEKRRVKMEQENQAVADQK